MTGWFARLCRRRILTRIVHWGGLASALFFIAVSAAAAHEIGKTQVVAIVNQDGTFAFDIAVDPDALLTQLQLARTGHVDGNNSRTEP